MSDSQPVSAHRAVFLSYASQDAEAARRICESLRGDGVEVWFDQEGGLEHGDEWDAKIRRQIKECVLFIPLVSANTQAREEGYFRLEWELAAERAMSIASGVPFILPIVIDDTREPDAVVPDRFRKVQWTRLPGGVVLPEVQARFLKLWSHRVGLMPPAEKRPAATESAFAPHAPALAPARKKTYAFVALAAILAALGWWAWRSSAPNPAPAATAAKLAAETKSTAAEKSLIVLPLENLSPDPENAFFTDGMHAELINAFSVIPNLKVISRPSSLKFRGSTATLADIAQQVGVANVITGSVRRGDGRVKIQLELRRARDEFLLLTKTYDRELRDVMTLQTEVAQDIARALEIRESRGSFEWARYQTKNLAAYDLYLKAVQRYLAPWGQAAHGLAEAEGCARDFQHVLDLDPSFAAAASFLSRSHTEAFSRSLDVAAAEEHARLARKWAEEFARLMPGGGGDGALALYYSNVEYKPARGAEFAEHVVRALPNDAAGIYYMSVAFAHQGRRAEQLAAVRRALEIDPLNATYRRDAVWGPVYLRHNAEALRAIQDYLRVTGGKADPVLLRVWRFILNGELPAPDAPGLGADWLYLLRRFEAAVQACDAARATNIAGWEGVSLGVIRSQAQLRLGRTDEARESALQALKLARGVALIGDSRWLAPRYSADALAAAGRVDEALQLNARGAAELAANRNSTDIFDVSRAEILAQAGRVADCVELLRKLLQAASGLTVPMLRVDPVWDNLRGDPAFKALLADPKNSAPL